MPNLVTVKRALISASDKAGVVELARALAAYGVELISTGGTAKTLAEAGLDVTPVERLTGTGEMLGGRVKTLHPGVHAALLARTADPDHAGALEELGIEPIDLVCVNLYPFERTIAGQGVAREDAIEQIDIGGPTMIRAAAKNHERIAVLTDPGQYERVTDNLRAHDGATSASLRAELAAEAFARTAQYDAAITQYLSANEPQETSPHAPALPDRLVIGGVRAATLRYGENPHQPAAVYRNPAGRGPSLVDARQRHGKALSYNNYADAGAAMTLVADLARQASERPAACVIKHTNPCGAAIADSPAEAIEAALGGDPLAAFGGILAASAPIDATAAERLTAGRSFLEVILAPSFSDEALELLRARWQQVRLLEVGGVDRDPSASTIDVRAIPGGWLAQRPDRWAADPASWTHAAGPAPSDGDLEAAAALEIVVRALTSNAVVIGGRTGAGAIAQFGAGAGQMDRVAACRLAAEKAGDRARGGIAVSDAFFPFPDGPQVLIDAGIRLILHPGGSKRDAEAFEACERAGVTCLTTGVRRFRH